MNQFINYVLSFYSHGEIYDMGMTKEEALIALGIRLERYKDIEFVGDTLDREKVRDIVIELRKNRLT